MIGRERGITPDKIGKEKGEFGRGRGRVDQSLQRGEDGWKEGVCCCQGPEKDFEVPDCEAPWVMSVA